MGKLFKKKVMGDSAYIATMISVWMILIFAFGFMYLYGEAVGRNDVERVPREYILAMEREGYLSNANRIRLINELSAMGCTNIVVTGSLSPVGYGNTVTLRIECDLRVRGLVIDGDGAKVEGRQMHIVMEESGTALY